MMVGGDGVPFFFFWFPFPLRRVPQAQITFREERHGPNLEAAFFSGCRALNQGLRIKCEVQRFFPLTEAVTAMQPPLVFDSFADC